jgi:hypothetical protein
MNKSVHQLGREPIWLGEPQFKIVIVTSESAQWNGGPY